MQTYYAALLHSACRTRRYCFSAVIYIRGKTSLPHPKNGLENRYSEVRISGACSIISGFHSRGGEPVRGLVRCTSMQRHIVTAIACLWTLPLVAQELPEAKWDHLPKAETWTQSALDALDDHGKPLVENVPGDIGEWCPAYVKAPEDERAAFWVGFLSTLAEFESTWRPDAVGSGKWFGLLQIAPATARAYECKAGTGEALKTGANNLSCAIRIMATTIERDGVLVKAGPDWAGAAADWGPLRSDSKSSKMQDWLIDRDYCST